MGIVLVADRLSALMLAGRRRWSRCAVLVYSHRAGHEDDDAPETPVSIFHPTYLVLAAGVSNAFLAGDLFNLFVGFEILLFATYVLLTLGGTERRGSARARSTWSSRCCPPLLFLIAHRHRSTRRPAR